MGSQEKFTYFFHESSPFSQWHSSDFKGTCTFSNSTHWFSNCEQWMIFNKALLFGDHPSAQQIIMEPSPEKCKRIGGNIKNFNSDDWDRNVQELVYQGAKLKFLQNSRLLRNLFQTQGTTLVKASPYDKIWGIGLDKDDPKSRSRETWNGLNLLGEILTKLRIDLIAEQFEESHLKVPQDCEKSQFQASLLGVLLGDAMGLPFEMKTPSDDEVQQHFDYMENSKDILPIYFSDDTSMTISVANSILECRGVTLQNMARRFAREFFRDGRYYGATVRNVFQELEDTNFVDVFSPAQKQQEGKGSHGNGAAMRVAPISLYTSGGGVENALTMIRMVVQSSRITHAHPLGIAGAVFQSIVIRNAMQFGQKRLETSNIPDPQASTKIPKEILSSVRNDLEQIRDGKINIEGAEYFSQGITDYLDKLDSIKEFLERGNSNVSKAEVISNLGTKVSALGSVPTAFYCFLASFNDIPNVKAENQFRRSIQYAVSLGGDTDTIASMTGAISGAYLGMEGLPTNLARHCYGGQLLTTISYKLHQFNKLGSGLLTLIS